MISILARICVNNDSMGGGVHALCVYAEASVIASVPLISYSELDG